MKVNHRAIWFRIDLSIRNQIAAEPVYGKVAPEPIKVGNSTDQKLCEKEFEQLKK